MEYYRAPWQKIKSSMKTDFYLLMMVNKYLFNIIVTINLENMTGQNLADNKVLQYFEDLRAKEIPVSGRMLQEKARLSST